MAVLSIGHHPNLTVEEAMAIFRRHLGDRYDILPAGLMLYRDFMVKKNAFVAVYVRLKQEPADTKLVFTGIAPSFLTRLLLGLTLGILARILFNRTMADVRDFIETCDEFRHPQASRPVSA